MVRGIQVFILLSLAGTVFFAWWRDSAGVGEVMADFRWIYAAALIPLVGLDYLLGGVRFRLFLNGRQATFVSLFDCMRSNWANMFMGAATPMQTGGAAAQVFILWRKGAWVAEGLLVSVVNFVATLVFFFVSSLAAYWWIAGDLVNDQLSSVYQLGLLVIAVVVALFLLALWFPKVAHAIGSQSLRVVPLRSKRWTAFKERVLDRLEGAAERFGSGFRMIWREAKVRILITVAATVALFFNKFLIGYMVALAMGETPPLGLFLGLQVILQVIAYFAPTPGASGIAEGASVLLMSHVMRPELTVIYTFLWRFATIYVAALIGGIVLFREVGRARREGSGGPGT